MKKKISNAGFTLTELIVVIAILGVLMAVAVPTYGAIVERARGNICKNNTASINYALSIRRQEQPIEDESITNDEAMLAVLSGFFPEGLPKCPSGGSYGYNKNCTVYCKKHQSPTLTIPMDTLETMKDLIAEVAEAEKLTDKEKKEAALKELLGDAYDGKWINNEKLRAAIYNKLGGTWPEIEIDGQKVFCQPIANNPTDSADVIIYANNKNKTDANWNAPYVFHPEENCWYKYIEKDKNGNNKSLSLAGRYWSKESFDKDNKKTAESMKKDIADP
ncbi:MAG: prepilin-type N-terminal cleavage/methylation domain-containing protein, partial [Oscillospiraceae bacterium]